MVMTFVSFLFFTGLVGLITWWIVRRDDCHSKEGFFLAGRSLTWPFIAGSLFLTNLSTEQLVGLNASAFNFGLSVMAWEVVAVVALVFMALFFLPRFLKSGIVTVPQFLEMRFDHHTGVITNLIFLVAYAVILLPIVLYTGARGLNSMLNIPEMLGVSEVASMWIVIWVVGIIGSIYALFGGLRTVAVSDTLNGIGLLTGGFMIVYFGLSFIGGDDGLAGGITALSANMPEKLNSVGGNLSEVPFSTLLSGVLFINVFYWCTNQQIIQRTLGASSLAEGQKGVLMTGFLKLFGPLYLVIPGLIGLYLYRNGFIDVGFKPGTMIPNADNAYGRLVSLVLPGPLTGFFAAVMVGAILSSFNSALNATCTLFSLGLYKGILKPQAEDRELVRVSQWFGWAIAVISMLVAPMLMQTTSIFDYLQKMNAIYFIPILAVVLIGMLTNRVPAAAANWSLLVGVAVILIGYFVPPFNLIVKSMNEYHFLGLVMFYLILFMLIYGTIAPRKKEYVQHEAKVIDMTPWRYTTHVGVILLLIVAGIYAYFADFSVLKAVPAVKNPLEQVVEQQIMD